jgi:fatty acid desaturase
MGAVVDIYIFLYIYIYVYIKYKMSVIKESERERERKREMEKGKINRKFKFIIIIIITTLFDMLLFSFIYSVYLLLWVIKFVYVTPFYLLKKKALFLLFICSILFPINSFP